MPASPTTAEGDLVGSEDLPLNFAQALAEAEGLNRASAGIAF